MGMRVMYAPEKQTRAFGTTYVLRMSSITYTSWKVLIVALESYCHGQKVGNLSQRREN